MNAEELLALRHEPPRMGRLASSACRAQFDGAAWVLPDAPVDPSAPATILRGETRLALASWPEPGTMTANDIVVLAVEPDDAPRWVAWLDALARHVADGGDAPAALAPFSTAAAGTHRLWAFATARLGGPEGTRVHARHDLLGIRLCQVALRFGADTLAGPVEPDRVLPLAGVTRPNESTLAGLQALIEQAGYRPQTSPGATP